MSMSSSSFHGLNNLTELHLDDNKLENLHISIFKDLKELQLLNLSGNAIEVLHDKLFADLVKLRVLNLNNNHINNLPINQFNRQTRLKILDIGDNALDYIHPWSFRKLSELTVIKINSNYLKSLHESTFQNNTHLHQIDLYDNPWDCNCGLRWLLSSVTDPESSSLFPNQNRIKCASPYNLHSFQLPTLKADALQCVEPEIHTSPYKKSIVYQHGALLHCNATGYPKPSIVWVTPRGKLLAHPNHRQWLKVNMSDFVTEQSYAGKPTYLESKVQVYPNGSLQVSQLRYYFAGEYVCMAMNPGGMVVNIVSIKIVSLMQQNFFGSLFIAGACALVALVLGIIAGCIRMLCERFCCHNEKPEHLDIINEIQHMNTEIHDISPPKSPWHQRSLFDIPEMDGSSCENYYYSSDNDDLNDTEGSHIKETLDDVKKRLRSGVDRTKERMRCRAQHIRESTNHTMQTIREKGQTIKVNASQSMQTIRQSASNSMHTIKQSSSQYATRLRTGVVLGVEQVKYHVQSMKELCGTGDIGQTVSCVSMSTDVDSQEQSSVFRTVTSVWRRANYVVHIYIYIYIYEDMYIVAA